MYWNKKITQNFVKYFFTKIFVRVDILDKLKSRFCVKKKWFIFCLVDVNTTDNVKNVEKAVTYSAKVDTPT